MQERVSSALSIVAVITTLPPAGFRSGFISLQDTRATPAISSILVMLFEVIKSYVFCQVSLSVSLFVISSGGRRSTFVVISSGVERSTFDDPSSAPNRQKDRPGSCPNLSFNVLDSVPSVLNGRIIRRSSIFSSASAGT